MATKANNSKNNVTKKSVINNQKFVNMKSDSKNKKQEPVETQTAEQPKAKKVKEQKPEVITGTLENGQMLVNVKDVVKPKKNKCEAYGMKPWEHIAKLQSGKGIVFIWDSRVALRTIDLDAIAPEDLLKNVKDSGSALKLDEQYSNDEVKALFK